MRTRRRLTLAMAALAALIFSVLPATTAQAEEELIVNGDFSAGMDAWVAVGDQSAGVTGGELCTDVAGGTANPWDVYLTQGDLSIQAGENYRLRFTASASRSLSIRSVVRSVASPEPAELSEATSIGTTAETFEYVFTAAQSSGTGEVRLLLGAHAEPFTFCVDDVSLVSGVQPPPINPGGESFVEEFDAGIDPNFWYVNDGYNNGGHQNCQFNADNATTANGILTLTLDDTPYGDRDYSCGAIQTNKRYSYGTYETRMKVGKASGTNSSLFSYVGPYHDEPHMEIDFEVLGKDPTAVELNTWVNGSSRGPWPVGIGYDSSEQWVDFAYAWEQDRIRFFINGELVQTVTDPADIPSRNQFIFTMLWGTDTLTDWMGPFEYPGQPITTEYEYVAFTRAGEDCQFAESVACDIDVQPPTTSFVDDFDTFDTSRWNVSDGWNNGARQNCTWDADQVGVSNGVLNLTYVEKDMGDRAYACAEVQHKKGLGYGTYEVRMKGVPGSGIMSTFFTWVGSSSSDPSEAIDIAKLLGLDTSQVKVNTWRDGQPLRPTFVDLPTASDQAFHDYGMVWTADQLDFYLNGEIVVSIVNKNRIPDRAAQMFLNVWASETTPEMGDFVPPDGPLTMQVDRVAYTAPGDGCQFTGSIAC